MQPNLGVLQIGIRAKVIKNQSIWRVVRHRISGGRWTSREYPPLPDFVPEPVYREFMPPEDEVLLTEEQPLPDAVSPTADSLGYVIELDPEEDPEEDDDEDPKEDPANYPVDGGDDNDDEDESSDDDEDDDDVDIEGGEEEEEHPVPTDSTTVALPAVDHAPSVEETELFETDESTATPPPHLAYRVTARISIRYELPTPFWSDIELRAEAPSTSHSPPLHIILSYTRENTPPSGTPPLLPIPLPTVSPSLLLPYVVHEADRPEVCLPPRKRLCFAFGPRYEVRESLSAAVARPTRDFRADYGFVATIDREIMRDLESDVSYGITNTWDKMLTERQLMAGQLNMLYRDRRAHDHTTLQMEREARMSREAWGRSMDASDLARLEAADRKRQVAITELLAADRRRQEQFIEALKLLKALQTQMTEMAPKRATTSNTAPETTNTTSVTNAQLHAMIDQGVTATLAARDAERNTNGDDSHNSGTGVRRTKQITRECTYTDFLKCQPLNFKGMEGFASLS
ncbi:hypothetical protein Tco_0763938 [Tanacetum coccineum]